MRSVADLPDDVDELKRRLIAAEAGLLAKTLEAEKLKFELARLRRISFGQSSERIEREIEQLELKLEEIETTAAVAGLPEFSEPAPAPTASPERKLRRKLPEHLPRREERHEPATCACPRCGCERLRKVGEDVTEILEYVPGRFEVVRHVRPAYSCSKCEAILRRPCRRCRSRVRWPAPASSHM